MKLRLLILCVCIMKYVFCVKNDIKIRSIHNPLAPFALCKLSSVATGKAKNELLKLLGINKNSKNCNFFSEFHDMIINLQNYDLTYLNKMYVNYNHPIKESFIENSLIKYGVHIEKIRFHYPKTAMDFINKEVSSATLRRVEEVVDPSDVNNDTSILLVTAAHCKPTWETPFDHRQTTVRSFRLLNDSTVDMPMITGVVDGQIYDAKDFRVVTIKLIHYGCSMTFIQPDFISLPRILDKLSDPAFMANLGVKEILSKNTTGFNNIFKKIVKNSKNMLVSNVLQKFFLEIDEFGVARVDKNPYPDEPRREPPAMVEVVLDRPFYFTINLELPTNDPMVNRVHELFAGVYYKPEN